MMKKYLTILLIAFSINGAFAQNASVAFKAQLAAKGANGARITITEGPLAKQALASYSPRGTVKGYRVSLYSGNNQNARNEAYAVQSRALGLYPNVKVSIEHNSPNFKVIAGSFLDKLEATIFLSYIRSSFSGAFIIEDSIIPITEFQVSYDITPIEVTEP